MLEKLANIRKWPALAAFSPSLNVLLGLKLVSVSFQASWFRSWQCPLAQLQNIECDSSGHNWHHYTNTIVTNAA